MILGPPAPMALGEPQPVVLALAALQRIFPNVLASLSVIPGLPLRRLLVTLNASARNSMVLYLLGPGIAAKRIHSNPNRAGPTTAFQPNVAVGALSRTRECRRVEVERQRRLSPETSARTWFRR